VIGGNLADTLTGNTLANNLNGGGGNDTINGGGGNDTLTGGAGADRFRFATTLNATTNRDVISDFSIAQMDTIELENAVFTAFTTTGTLAAPAFFIGAAATNANQRILYNSATGGLVYDEDGSGAIGSIAFATLNSGLALNNTFFTIT
jgi:Ca2+-binding RTX toxin-like protein